MNESHIPPGEESPLSCRNFEIIQQWQYLGDVHPALLTDAALENCRRIGVTSLQSYVTWAQIEKTEGILDFSAYDPLVEALHKHHLKWVPFLILGPCYATPEWFRQSSRSLYAKCLEHGRESKIQSIWNPHLPSCVDHFLSAFSRHYRDDDLLESISLGISGNWGEAIYPATGCFHGRFHVHPGWWCGDDYARESFRRYAVRKYESLAQLNIRWATKFRDHLEIGFPQITHSRWKDLYYEVIKLIPYAIKPGLKKVKAGLNEILASCREHRGQVNHGGDGCDDMQSPKVRRWIDFVEWYQASMTDWADFWLRTARRYFPAERMYLVTGGEGEPFLGGDLAAQARLAAGWNAGIRITNQSDDYGESFARTRLISAASRQYGCYFTTEEAGMSKPEGVTMRIFDAVTSGADGLYCKSLIGIGHDVCTGRDQPHGEITKGGENLRQAGHHLLKLSPILNVAVLFPNSSIFLRAGILASLYSRCARLRASVDFDLVDENMISDACLDKYRFLVSFVGNLLRRNTLDGISDWIGKGGVFIASAQSRPIAVGLGATLREVPVRQSDCEHGVMERLGAGYVLVFRGNRKDHCRSVPEAVFNVEKRYPWKGAPEIPNGKTNRYYSTFSDRIIFYDPSVSQIRVRRLNGEAGTA